MQRSNAWESSSHEVCLLFSRLREQASEPGRTYLSQANTSPAVTVPKLLHSRTRTRRRRRKRAWKASCPFLLRCATSPARRRLAAAIHEGEHNGTCCQISY
jgi:hypothetical protein